MSMSSASGGLCFKCLACRKKFDTREKYTLFECFDVTLLEGKISRQNNVRLTKSDKNLKRANIIMKVSALRNSGGGSLLIHMKGFPLGNRCMRLFNEYIDVSLNSLIEDGSHFDTEYFKRWYSDNQEEDGYEYLVITVTACSTVSTADFKTRMALDDAVVRPTSQNMDVLLFGTKHTSRALSTATLLGMSITEECRNVQFKSIQPGWFASRTLSEFIDYIWNELRFAEYVTSFSKLTKGGSFYIGVTEVSHSEKSEFVGIPIPVRQHDQFRQKMYESVKNISHFSSAENSLGPFDTAFLKIEFYHTKGDNYVIEIAVAPVTGCVFYDCLGPETYILNSNGTMERLTFSDWFDLFKKRSFCASCKGLIHDSVSN